MFMVLSWISPPELFLMLYFSSATKLMLEIVIALYTEFCTILPASMPKYCVPPVRFCALESLKVMSTWFAVTSPSRIKMRFMFIKSDETDSAVKSPAIP